MICLQSCNEKILNENLPFEGQKLVVEGFLTPTEPIEISVYQTLPPTGDLIDDRYVENATVQLFENAVLVETLTHDEEGIYYSPRDFRPQFGKSYHIEVVADNFPKVVSETEILPDTIPVFSWSFVDSLFVDNNTIEGRLSFEFQDIMNEANFYNILVEGVDINGERNVVAYFKEDFITENPACEYAEFFRDKCFENDWFRYDFTTNTRSHGEAPNQQQQYKQLRLTLQIAPESHYNYKRFLSVADNNEGNPFAEPVEFYTNIDGGYGVFTTYLERVVIINL